MRILIVNGNTNAAMTETLAATARGAAAPGTEIAAATAAFGAGIVSHRAEEAIAGHAILKAIADHDGGYDGVLIGVSTDPALGAARALLRTPVVGMTEAALLTACMLGARFGLITFSLASAPGYREAVERYGLTSRLAGLRTIDIPLAQAFAEREKLTEAIVETADALIEADGAEALILAGAAAAGLPAGLQPHVPVPLLDGIVCGVRLTEAMIHLGTPKPSRGSHAPPAANRYTGLDEATARLLRENAETRGRR